MSAIVAPVKVRLVNRERSSIGSSARRSAITKAISGERRHGQGGDDARRGPADLGTLDEGEGQGEQSHGREGHAAGVDAAAHGAVGRRDHAGAEPQGGDADGHVDEEDPVPVDVLGEHASEQRPSGESDGADGAPGADRAGLLARVGVGGLQDGQGGRREQGGAEALQRPAGDEEIDLLDEPGEERRGGEDRQAEHEEALLAEQVGEPAAGEQEAGEDEDVGTDHPFHAGLGEVQASFDGRDRDVDDVVVQVGHERAKRHRDQRPVAGRGAARRAGLSAEGCGWAAHLCLSCGRMPSTTMRRRCTPYSHIRRIVLYGV